MEPSQSLSIPSPAGQVQASFNFSIVPKLRMKIYSVVVPYIHPSAHLEVIGSLALTGIDWDISAEAYAGFEMGLNFEVLGETFPLFTPINGESPHVDIYKTPYSVQLVSGNNQIGNPGELLPDPIKFKVQDQWGNSQQNVFLYLDMLTGEGTLSGDTLVTDENGECEVLWTLSSDALQTNEFSARALDGSSNDLISSPLSVHAVLANECDSLIVDSRDGQEYCVVQIGDQWWFAENLRYSGNIPYVTSGTNQWGWVLCAPPCNVPPPQPAWCYYMNDSANDSLFGKLYNGAAINTENVCPTGWHLPSDAEWYQLTDYLGSEEVAGGKMKSFTGWDLPNTSATNESGFSGLPGGRRLFGYGPVEIGAAAYWWTSTESDDIPIFESQEGTKWIRSIYYDDGQIYRDYALIRSGCSVRCVKD